MFCAIPDTSLFLQKPSGAEGWHGIIPGETSKERVISVLRNSPYVRRVSIQPPEVHHHGKTEFQVIYWDNQLVSLALSPQGLWPWSRAIIVEEKVKGVAIYCYNSKMTAQHIIARLGKPEKVARYSDSGGTEGRYRAIILLYPRQGVAVTHMEAGAYSGGSFVTGLQPHSRAMWIYYFEPTSADELASAIGPMLYMDLSQMQDWNGYDSVPNP
jgi:hypothetical protein